MRCDVITLFPELFSPFLDVGMVGRAVKAGLLAVNLIWLREFGEGVHRSVDDRPYGGGPGMVMMAPPLMRAIESIEREKSSLLLIMSPAGEIFSQDMARSFLKFDQLLIVCGRYEGIDQRIVELSGAREVSIGDYVLSGGEIPAMVIIDAITRLLPGVLGDESSSVEESFKEGLLEYPQYTRPRIFMGLGVPEVLLSGNHKEIEEWRRAQALLRTKARRPDLFERLLLSKRDMELMERYSQ
ncbi:MAG: tRNA (guanosine(37)-N1)-methyltransferase TrmD [Desulfatiglandales bacterium]